jgi:hypothetical protein
MADLIERLGISEDQVRVIDVKEVSLAGCFAGLSPAGDGLRAGDHTGILDPARSFRKQYPYHTDMDTQRLPLSRRCSAQFSDHTGRD